MRLASYQVTIAAPVEVVWAHLTTAEGLVRWVGPEATLRLVHHGLPPETVPDHQQGWRYFLGVLRDSVSAT